MTITLDAGQIVGFLALCLGIGPSLLYVGALSVKVRRLESDRVADRVEATAHRDALWAEVREMRSKLDQLYGRFIVEPERREP